MTNEPLPPKRRLQWDLPSRICHWGFAATSGAALFLGSRFPPSSTEFKLHIPAGILCGWFLSMRIALAFFGSDSMHWRGLFHPPREAFRYVKKVLQWRQSAYTRLNPGSALFALTFYLSIAALIWSGFVPDWAERWHGPVAYLMLALIGVHLTGLSLHAVRHRSMTALSMVHGTSQEDGPSVRNRSAVGFLLLCLTLLVTWMLFQGFDQVSSTLHVPWIGDFNLPLTEKG